ncbi:MAG: tRNA (adenosine(37)-N6)-threonylcarbamoyltransferase complex ATPase subunit type 1 TsaE [Gemmatimonadaceae bacterium]
MMDATPWLPEAATPVTLAELVAYGESIGRAIRPPHVLAIAGDLGAGKTTLVQAICRGYGVSEEVTSPTFALVHQYRAPRSPVFHLDLYRLRGESELTNLAWDDIVNERALVLVEWPERAGSSLPGSATRVQLQHDPRDPSVRLLTVGAA